ncbi:MAG: SUMF1/EgtB/PvdO family nonheme iron enzyme [Verrucomicrobia bacterium]|nr:SUMF1/EgtB/PvdO family nonheme iron enzyme [Verrucomicrobiota bacterium]
MKTPRLVRQTLLSGSVLLLFTFTSVLAVPPVVSNIRASQRAGTHLIDIYYNVSDADGNSPLTVYVAVSDNAGASYNVPVFTLIGAVGPGVTPGTDRHIVWNAGTDWPGRFSSQCRVRITADDGTAPPAPAGMAYIPAGPFQMGDSFMEGNINELPVHTVYLSAFFMDKNLVSRELWLDVYAWALGHGYNFNNSGSFRDANHPVQTINWYDAVKWCNARSEKEGLTACYYTDASQTTVYRSWNFAIINAYVKVSASGYRLPTEAEWEKAARGGLNGKRFPWGDTITHSNANYYSSASYAYDVSPTRGNHPTYGTGSQPYTSPIGSFAANGYGLFDMVGNLWEWCWDWHGSTFYGDPSAGNDPHGPSSDVRRVVRGGSWNSESWYLRISNRKYAHSLPGWGYMNNGFEPGDSVSTIGFRCVRGLSF